MDLLFFNFHSSLSRGRSLTEAFRRLLFGSAEAVPGIFKGHGHP